MGRGDKKSTKGKRSKGSYGVSRNRKTIKARLRRSVSKKKEEASGDAPSKPKRAAAAKKKAE